MKIVERSVSLVYPQQYEQMLATVEAAGRNCYQSYAKQTDGSAEKLIRKFIKADHGTPLEFADITVRIVADRAFLAQITRHRLASFCVESARYNDYADGCYFVQPYDIRGDGEVITWKQACEQAEQAYQELRLMRCNPETARSVLPMSLATQIVMKANVREWRHILKLRLDKHAQIDMRGVMRNLLYLFYDAYPVFFEDIAKDVWGETDETAD